MKQRFTTLRSFLALTALGLMSMNTARAQSFTEGFDATSTLADWYVRNNSDTIISTTHARNWGFGNPANFVAQAGATGSYLSAGYTSTNSTASTGATLSNWLFTPARTFANGDVISFYTRVPANPTNYADRLEVRLSTAGTGLNVGTTSTSVGDYTTVLLTVNPTLSGTGYPGTWTQYTATITGLSAPTTGRVAFRYFVTNGGPNGLNSNVIGVDTYSYTSVSVPPANDNCAGATILTPGATCTPVSGSVSFATQSQVACGDGTANDDVWYKFTATTTGANITVDGSTNFDAVFEVFSGACGTLTSIACVDNSVSDEVETTTLNNLVIGQTYYIRVFDWYAGMPATPGFTICVTEFTQCDLTQPAGSILETETCGQDLNGGCTMTTPAYQTLSCGQTVFGKAWNNGTNRDTDWYSFTITTPGTATWTANAEFPFQIYFLNVSNCAAPVALASASSNACASATISYNFTTPGTYVAFIAPNVFSGYACGTYNDYIATLTLPIAAPVITPAGSTAICASNSGSVTLNASQSGTFSWFQGTTAVGGTTSSYTAAAPGAYTVKVTDNNGCVSALSAAVTVTAATPDDASFAYPSNTICDGGSNVTPTAATAGTYAATPSGLAINTTTGEIDVATSNPGTYTITHSVNVSCPNTSTQTITITSAPETEFSYAGTTYCSNASNPAPVFVTGASAGAFSSTAGLLINSSTGVINLSGSTPGTYTVTNAIAASGSCPASSSSTTVTIASIPTATVSGGGSFCGTGSATVTITLTGQAPFDFTYSNGTTPTTVTGHAQNTYTITATAAGNYTVSNVSDAVCSSTGTGSATVSVFQNPTVTLTGLTSTVCSNAAPVSLTQGLPAGGTYSGTGVTGNTFTPSAPGATTVTYSYTDANGCSGSATGTITVEAAPTVALAALADVCSYVPAYALSGGSPAGGTYSGPGVSGGNFNPATAGVGTHTITYTYANTTGALCSASATKTITVKNCAGLEETTIENSLAVYPNPADETLTVSFQSVNAISPVISILSLDGKMVYSQQTAQANDFSQEINVSGFPAGIYLINIQTVNGSATRRIVIQ